MRTSSRAAAYPTGHPNRRAGGLDRCRNVARLSLVLALATACDVHAVMARATVDPRSTHGDALAGTEGIQPMGTESFSVSPDGRWSLFPLEGGTAATPRYVLYDLLTLARQEIGLGDQARQLTAQGRRFLPRAGCWDADSRRVVVPGDGLLFTLNPSHQPREWMVIDAPPRTEYATYYHCDDRGAHARVRVERLNARTVQLVSASQPDHVLARHETVDPTVLGLDVSHVTASRDGRWIAYVLTVDRLSFAAPPRGFLLELASTRAPRLLAAPVFGPFRWSPDSHYLYACARGRDRTLAIFRWETSHAG